MRGFCCDLHIHSVLSPCGDLDMSPRSIVDRARQIGLDIIAITDHNIMENSFYAHILGRRAGVSVFFGMELQTQEEIHLLAIFDNLETGMKFQEIVYRLLPCVKNDPLYFGDQVVVNEKDEILRFEEKLLLNSVEITIGDAVKWISSHGGVAIPSHIDSKSFSVISQLGYVPDDISFDALEVRDLKNMEGIIPFVRRRDIPFVSFSDAHYLKDIGKRKTSLVMEEPTCREIKRALRAMAVKGADPV